MNYKFMKKPVIIEAFQMTKERRWDNKDWPNWLNQAWNTEGQGGVWPNKDDHDAEGQASAERLVCGTLEGDHIIDIDDFIIQGVKGEIYACKPDIFELSYLEVPEK